MNEVTSWETWHDLFLAGAGAGSALAGLIIVAMSVNVDRILVIPSMTSRAATTVAQLVLIVVVTCAGLIPDQPTAAFGAELLASAGLVLALALRSGWEIIRYRGSTSSFGFAVLKASLGILPPAGTLVAGILLCGTAASGLYVLASAVVAGFATSVTNAWVLLIEIRR